MSFLKLILLGFLVLIISGILFYVLKPENNAQESFMLYQLGSQKLKLLVADEPAEWQKGLMFVECPCDFDGMIFLFPEKRIRSFWNKNTFVDLKVYWLDDDQIVGEDYLPSIRRTKEIKVTTSSVKVNKVIELILKEKQYNENRD